MLIERIGRFIADHRLLNADQTQLVALSGGADSVALLVILHELGYQLEAIHCNFHLRGDEADRDESFCASLCDGLGIPFHRAHFATREYASLHHVSIEMAARELRYGYFERLRRDIGAENICVGHHKNDAVETVLMNLIRGTGLQGLTGIASRNVHIVRPLLSVSHEELVGFLGERNQAFVTDSSNLVDDVVRNKIRLNLIPLLNQVNPAACDHVARTAEYLSEVRDFAMSQADQILREATTERGGISLSRLISEKGYKFLIFQLLNDKGFTSSQMSEICRTTEETGRAWSSETHECTIDRGCLYVREKKQAWKTAKLPEPGVYQLSGNRKWRLAVVDRQVDFKPSKERWHITIDEELTPLPLTIRVAKQGDKFKPFGMRGNKLVSDYLTDKKKNLFEKRDQLVVTDARGKIVWLVGERISEECKITDSTRRVIHLSVE